MKMNGFIITAMLTMALGGCDVAKGMTTVGFKQGEGVVEKGVIKYDGLVDKDEDCTKAWADYESQLQRRADLIPQLASVVKGAAKHENSTLTNVMKARSEASSIHLNPAAGDFEDAKKFAEYQATQQKVHTALQQLQENYPQLQANENFKNFQTQIEGTENRLNRARQVYNDKVAEFNKELRHVSGKVINPITGWEFKPRIPFQASEEAKVAPKINLE